MIIHFSGAGKRFNRDWIFRRINSTFESGNTYAITGPNGSGKSTLLQVIAANMQASEGKVQWTNSDTVVSENEVYHYISVCAPYLEVIEEMTAAEFLTFHAAFKPYCRRFPSHKLLRLLVCKKRLISKSGISAAA